MKMFDFLNPEEPSKNTIANDSIDRMVHESILKQSPDLRAIKEKGSELIKTFPYLQEDIFFSLYKPWPELLDKERISRECSFNRQEMEKLLETPSYKELRQYTQLDEFGSGLGSKALLEELCNRLAEDSVLNETAKQVNKAAQSQQKAEDLQKELEGLQGKSKDSQKIQKEIQQFSQNAEQAAAKAEEMMASAQSQLRRAVTAAAEKAVGECEETEAVLTAWGFNQGQFHQLPFEKKLELVKTLRTQKKFTDMAKLVGRMRNLALASQKAKLDQVRVELHSITTGDDIARALTQELVSLRKPALKLNFYRKLYEKQLLQYDLQYREKLGRGPIVCLIDSSGSMSGAKDEWAKAVAMGLLEIAIKERRAFAYAVFSSMKDPLITDTFMPGERSPEKVLKMVISFYGGGTNFVKPLKWAVEKIKESAFTKADIVMITDGCCSVGDDFLKELLAAKEKKKFAVYSILIGSCSYDLKNWSDQVWNISDLFDDSVAESLYQSI
jgi:uncharacterized protein with von Willebrand factor type A (vWA) domain